MPEVEDLFERFDKGDIRTVEREIAAGDTDANGNVVVTIKDLISVEGVVSVLYFNDTAGEYQPIAADAADGETFAATVQDITDNDVTIQFYTADSAAVFAETGSATAHNQVKIVARGY